MRIVAQFLLSILAGGVACSIAAEDVVVDALKFSVRETTISGGENAFAEIAVARNKLAAPGPLQFRLESSNTSLVPLAKVSEMTIAENQESVRFEIPTATTQIATSVRLRAALGPKYNQSADLLLTLVPARLSRVTVTPATMIGTIGSTVQCTAELRAVAPAGGIELYVGPYTSTSVKTKSGPASAYETVRVLAGSRTVSFPIVYDDVLTSFSSLHQNDSEFSATFEAQTRRIEFVVALDPQPTIPWQIIPHKAIKASFDVMPLKVVSFSVQASPLRGGTESIATVALTASPGSGETIFIGAATPLRIVPLGSSCQITSRLVEAALTPGTATQTFKACAEAVTAPVSAEGTLYLRSGEYDFTVPVAP